MQEIKWQSSDGPSACAVITGARKRFHWVRQSAESDSSVADGTLTEPSSWAHAAVLTALVEKHGQVGGQSCRAYVNAPP